MLLPQNFEFDILDTFHSKGISSLCWVWCCRSLGIGHILLCLVYSPCFSPKRCFMVVCRVRWTSIKCKSSSTRLKAVWILLNFLFMFFTTLFFIWQCAAELVNDRADSEAELTRFHLSMLHANSSSSGRRGRAASTIRYAELFWARPKNLSWNLQAESIDFFITMNICAP